MTKNLTSIEEMTGARFIKGKGREYHHGRETTLSLKALEGRAGNEVEGSSDTREDEESDLVAQQSLP